MKLKINILFLFFLQLSNGQNKENNFYIGLNYGSNFSLADKNIIENKIIGNDIKGNQTVSGIFFGYMFNKNIGVEIGYNKFQNDMPEFEWIEGKINESTSLELMKIALVLSGDYKKINPYSKISLAIAKNIEIKYSADKIFRYHADHTPSTEYISIPYYQRYINSGGSTLGFDVALGLEFKIYKTIYLFGELDYLYLEYSPEKTEYQTLDVGYEYVGPNTNPKYSYQVLYFDENNNPNLNKDKYLNAHVRSVRTRIINNIFFNIGIKVNL